MKKFLMIISVAVMALCLTACTGENTTGSGNSELSQSTEISQTSSSSATTESESSSEVSQTSSSIMSTDGESSSENSEISAPSEATSTTKTESEPPAETPSSTADTPVSEPNSEEVSKILVAYFSATNNTEGVAQKLANGLGADLYEITPQQPYTSEDLNYGNSKSRTSVEMNDPNARPVISGSVDNMEQYDVVLIGYPIWWGNAPRIMSTFIESYDFSGKTLAAFCTSASSGFGNSDSALRSATSGATWLKGQRFSAGANADDVMKWAKEIGVG